jgi:hypothetical protein
VLEGLETIQKIFRIDRREIAFLRFIFEGCDGVAQLTTLDRRAGIVAVRIPPGCQRDVAQVLEGLSGEILMEPI